MSRGRNEELFRQDMSSGRIVQRMNCPVKNCQGKNFPAEELCIWEELSRAKNGPGEELSPGKSCI